MKKSAIALAALLSACAPVAPLETASGRPEVCIKSKPVIVSSEIAGKIVDRGYTLVSQSETIVQAEKRLQGAQALLLASKYNPNPVGRITFNLIKTQACTRVVVDLVGVSNPGSGYEKTTPLSNPTDNHAIQSWLLDVKTYLERHQ